MKYVTLIVVIGCLFVARAAAQDTASNHQHKHHFAVYAAFGPNVYFNNLQLGANNVSVFNYSFVGRFMWEPGHLLSLGFETGYYRLYTVHTPEGGNVNISNSAIPIQIVVGMRFLQSFYFNWSMGQSVLLNRVHSGTYGDINATTFSLGDFTATLGYKHTLTDRFSIGVESKFFYSARANDYSLAVVFVGGYRF